MPDFYYYGTLEPGETKEDKLQKSLYVNTPKLIAVDTETISLADRTPLGVGIGISPTEAFYFPTYPDITPKLPVHLLTDPTVTKVFHNAPFDMEVLDLASIDVGVQFDVYNVRDTKVMAHLLMREDAQLKWLMWEVNKDAHDTAEEMMTKHKAKTMLDIPEEEVALHCCKDVQGTIALYQKWVTEVDMPYFLIEMALIPILLKMSKRGIAIDHEARDALEIRLTKEVEFLRGIAEQEGFNPGSAQQVGYILAKRGNFLPFTRSKKALATGKEVLEFVDDPIAALVINYRSTANHLRTYILPLKDEPRCYTHFHLDAVTGRITSTKRNLQNVPSELRSMFIPDSDCFDSFDYSQIELITLTDRSQDLDMLKIYSEGGDIHQETADFMEIHRRIAKNVNFAMIYGATAHTIRETAHIKDIRRCEQLLSDWFMKYKRAGEWIRETQAWGLEHGYITTLYGRNIKLPMGEGDEQVKRKAVNYIVQGSAAEIVKRAMIKCAHLPMVLQIHDELLFDGRVELPDGLDNIAPFRTPISRKELIRWE